MKKKISQDQLKTPIELSENYFEFFNVNRKIKLKTKTKKEIKIKKVKKIEELKAKKRKIDVIRMYKSKRINWSEN